MRRVGPERVASRIRSAEAAPQSPASAVGGESGKKTARGGDPKGMGARSYIQSVEWGLKKVDADNRVISITLLTRSSGLEEDAQ